MCCARMLRVSLAVPSAGAPWIGITTRINECLLEAVAVDAMLTMAPDPEDTWKSVLVKNMVPEQLAAG